MTTENSDSASAHAKHPNLAGTPTGRLFIVSAPSGAGKTTLCGAMRRRYPNLAYSVSYTTRKSRKGEVHGRDYFFITVKEFEDGIANGRWAEWAKVHENYYGTSVDWIDRTLATGCSVLMDIDLQGACQIVQRYPKAITIFIEPPSLEVLGDRLRSRGTDDPETIALRMANARQEIAKKGICRHILVNDDLEEAEEQMSSLFKRYLAPDASQR